MGQSILIEALYQPATSVLVLVCCGIWYLLHRRGLGYPDVGMSFDAVVGNHELWRMVTSQLSHVDLLHLVFNVSALWSVGVVERARGLGTVYYLQQSALMFILSPLICLGLYYILVKYAKREEYRHVTAVGYSCVIFAWMTVLAVRQPGGITMLPIFGLANVPMWLTPFASLIITSILIPKASFLGHLSGIIAGFIISSGILDGLGPWGALGLLTAALTGVAWVAASRNQLPYIQLPGSEPDIEAAGGGQGQTRIVNGVIQRR